MSWRTVVISNQSKLDYKMGLMVVRGIEIKKVVLDEIAVLVIENPAVSFTGCLVEKLIEKKIKVIFCDSRHDPVAELVPHRGSHDSSQKIRTQAKWSDDIKAIIWREIVSEKIRKQKEFLEDLNRTEEAALLSTYLDNVELNDATNREGHAAKVYFNTLFGKDFTRSEGTVANSALNYAYSIILSCFNREVSANGYLTQLGIFHDNMFNHFNLSCDLMEPFRIIADRYVYNHALHESEIFDKDEKHLIWNLVNTEVFIDNCNRRMLDAVKIYTHSVFEAVNDGDPALIKFYEFL